MILVNSSRQNLYKRHGVSTQSLDVLKTKKCLTEVSRPMWRRCLSKTAHTVAVRHASYGVLFADFHYTSEHITEMISWTIGRVIRFERRPCRTAYQCTMNLCPSKSPTTVRHLKFLVAFATCSAILSRYFPDALRQQLNRSQSHLWENIFWTAPNRELLWICKNPICQIYYACCPAIHCVCHSFDPRSTGCSLGCLALRTFRHQHSIALRISAETIPFPD